MARTLALVRHGQSTFNARNMFTGWRDPPLTEVGCAEARAIGETLRREIVAVDEVFTSALERARRSAEIVLQTLGLEACPITSDAALNERDYGELTGLDKDQARARWGEDQVRTWRRSYVQGPPGGESLRDTAARVLPFYIRRIVPTVMAQRSALVVAHGNTLRALVMALDGLSPLDVEELEIATGEILVYDLDRDTRATRRTDLAPVTRLEASP